jgi:hypothetical protein
MKLCGSVAIQALSELILLFFPLSFCSLKRRQKTKQKKNGRLLSGGPVKRLPASPQLPVFLGYYVI